MSHKPHGKAGSYVNHTSTSIVKMNTRVKTVVHCLEEPGKQEGHQNEECGETYTKIEEIATRLSKQNNSNLWKHCVRDEITLEKGDRIAEKAAIQWWVRSKGLVKHGQYCITKTFTTANKSWFRTFLWTGLELWTPAMLKNAKGRQINLVGVRLKRYECYEQAE